MPNHAVPLRKAQDFWTGKISIPLAVARTAIGKAINSCSIAPQTASAAQALQEQATALDKWYNTPHEWTGMVSVIPDSSCSFSITESFLTADTTPNVTVSFTAGQPRMTVSVGPLFSEIQDRSYSVVTAPPANGTSTNQTVLQVGGLSRLSTYLTGLLNFSLPFQRDWLNGERGGFALSTGPVVRVGGQSSTSAFGWFVGPSYYLYHLVYLSGGIHVGQFAGMPAGFKMPGQMVPSGFPTPTPLARTTVRLSFAITLKAKDLTALGKTGGKATAPAVQTTPKPSK